MLPRNEDHEVVNTETENSPDAGELEWHAMLNMSDDSNDAENNYKFERM